MSKKILICLSAALVLLECNNGKNKTESTGYTVKGTLKGIDSGMVKLVSNNEDDRTSKTIDSASFKNGTFEL
jgi:hypothetical protein